MQSVIILIFKPTQTSLSKKQEKTGIFLSLFLTIALHLLVCKVLIRIRDLVPKQVEHQVLMQTDDPCNLPYPVFELPGMDKFIGSRGRFFNEVVKPVQARSVQHHNRQWDILPNCL
jgi:hypothetical protein